MDFRRVLLTPKPSPVHVPVHVPKQGTIFTIVNCSRSIVAGDDYRKRITAYCSMCFFDKGHHQKWDFVFEMITSSFPPSQEGFQKSVFSHLEGLGYNPSANARFRLV